MQPGAAQDDHTEPPVYKPFLHLLDLAKTNCTCGLNTTEAKGEKCVQCSNTIPYTYLVQRYGRGRRDGK